MKKFKKDKNGFIVEKPKEQFNMQKYHVNEYHKLLKEKDYSGAAIHYLSIWANLRPRPHVKVIEQVKIVEERLNARKSNEAMRD